MADRLLTVRRLIIEPYVDIFVDRPVLTGYQLSAPVRLDGSVDSMQAISPRSAVTVKVGPLLMLD